MGEKNRMDNEVDGGEGRYYLLKYGKEKLKGLHQTQIAEY